MTLTATSLDEFIEGSPVAVCLLAALTTARRARLQYCFGLVWLVTLEPAGVLSSFKSLLLLGSFNFGLIARFPFSLSLLLCFG